MTYPSEAQLIEMEQRARVLLDEAVLELSGIEGQESRNGHTYALKKAQRQFERDESITRDVLTLVALVRAGSRKAAA